MKQPSPGPQQPRSPFRKSAHLQTPRRRTILARAISPATIVLACAMAPFALGDAIFAPGNQILGGQINTGTNQFMIGAGNGAVGSNTWPNAESPDHVIDGFAQKYLNFGILNTGFLVNPVFNGGAGSVVTSMQLWTANDSENRDPSSYIIYGTNAALDFGQTTFDLAQFTLVSSGALALPPGRGPAGTNPLNNTNSQTITFANTAGYKEYLVVFPTVKNAPGAANSMQIGEVQLFGVNSYLSLTWKGANSSVWNIATTANWDAGGTATTYNDGSGVVFDDTAPANRTTITIAGSGGSVKPAAVTFQNNTLDYTIGGDAIISTGIFLKTGSAAVTVNNSLTFDGGVSVNAGALNVGATGSVGTSPVAVNNAGAPGPVSLNFSTAQSIGTLSGTVLLGNTATINLNGNLTITQAIDAVYQGSIAGTGGLIKNGPGLLTLTGVNTYTGPTIVNGGILQSSAPGDNAQGALPAAQPVTVNANSLLVFGADDGVGYYTGSVSGVTVNGGTVFSMPNTHSTLPVVTLSGGTLTGPNAGNVSGASAVNFILDGDVSTTASAAPSKISATTVRLRHDQQNTGTSTPLTFNVARGTTPVDLELSSIVQDLGAGLIKSGTGILSLSNANTYTGPTVINSGTILVQNSAALGTGAVTINNGGALSFGMAMTLNGFGGLTYNGGASIDSTGTVLTLTDNLGNEARSVYTTTPLNVANGFVADFVYTAGGNRAADGAAFVIQNNSPTSIGTPGGGLGYGGVPNSIAIQLNIYTGGGQPVGTALGTQGTTGTYTPSDPVNLASGRPIFVHLAYDQVNLTLTETLTDPLTQATYTTSFPGLDILSTIGSPTAYVGFSGATGGAVALQQIGNFSFSNFSQGPSIGNDVAIAGGGAATLDVVPASAGGFGSATVRGRLTMNANSTLNVTGGATPTNSAFRINVTGQTSLAGNATFNVANNGTGIGTLELANIAQVGAGTTLTKTGPGTLAISGNAGHTGATTVNAGTLLVNGSVTGSSTTVNTGGTLGGIGSVGNVTVANGGSLAPGDGGIGTLTAFSLTMQGGSTLRLEIGATTGDQARAAGATLSGSIPLAITLLADPVENTEFTIIDGTFALGGYAGGARFTYGGNPLNEGASFQVNSGTFSQFFTISYNADAGHDVVLVAIPEPGSASLLALASGGVFGLRRRRRRHQG